MEVYRQGDVLITRVDENSVDLSDKTPDKRDSGRVVLAYGEATGHAHAIHENNAFLYTMNEVDEDKLFERESYLRVEGDAVNLVHEEHDTIKLLSGLFKITHQKEYTPGRVVSVVD